MKEAQPPGVPGQEIPEKIPPGPTGPGKMPPGYDKDPDKIPGEEPLPDIEHDDEKGGDKEIDPQDPQDPDRELPSDPTWRKDRDYRKRREDRPQDLPPLQ